MPSEDGVSARTGSRSPRRREDGVLEASDQQKIHDGFMERLSVQRAYLEKILEQRPPPPSGPPRGLAAGLAAGLSVEITRALLFSTGGAGGAVAHPWRALAAPFACVAAALRLFSQLMPEKVHECACERYCAVMAEESVNQSLAPVEALLEAAHAMGLPARSVSSGVESLQAMVRQEPVVCCAVLEGYIGVLEHPETGEEVEHEIGQHCMMVTGGDITGPSYVVFDPWGGPGGGGEVTHWRGDDLAHAAVVSWVELAPPS
eukprot:gnl/TRDRNA2_/TRDRNA2_36584_c0_seq1.p1 gnl/TRDRNA2_/TRDRNA2_36584_c0~~gnl/TRDRNA2_/TRDRNA2_36584_c0_seq1.p1  ORF type:complete len:260 (-),score=49.97 gnl/TRDRNA2_/TRDRNA2_36584_c0_seq1:82-861(-)